MITAEDLARAALQGYFEDPTGFGDMRGSTQRKRAVKRVELLLSDAEAEAEAEESAQASPK